MLYTLLDEELCCYNIEQMAKSIGNERIIVPGDDVIISMTHNDVIF